VEKLLDETLFDETGLDKKLDFEPRDLAKRDAV
jgi:hypothetical protein